MRTELDRLIREIDAEIERTRGALEESDKQLRESDEATAKLIELMSGPRKMDMREALEVLRRAGLLKD